MAVDKLVDSTALDAGLTTVANAIRTKGGTSEQLSFPQGMAEAIAAISGGGGLPIGVTAIDYGEFTLTEDLGQTSSYESITINHNLGDYPKFIYLWTEELNDRMVREEQYYMIQNMYGRTVEEISNSSRGVFQFTQKTGNYRKVNGNMSGFFAGISDTGKSSFIVQGITYENLPRLKGGIKYKWLAMV